MGNGRKKKEKINVKLSLCLTNHYAKKVCGAAEAWFYATIHNLGKGGSNWTVSGPWSLEPGVR
jgi:hypothetical protein